MESVSIARWIPEDAECFCTTLLLRVVNGMMEIAIVQLTKES